MSWNDLGDIDETRPLDDDDLEALNRIRQVLEECGLTKRFGVALLHKHFELRDGELLIETVDADGRTLTTEPKVGPFGEGELVPTTFRFVEGSEGLEATQYCYREPGWPDWLHAT